MSLNGFSRPLRLSLKPSSILKYHIVLLHLLALLAICLATLPNSLSVFFFSALIISASYYWWLFSSVVKMKSIEWVLLNETDWVEKTHDKPVWWKLNKIHVVTDWFITLQLANNKNESKHLLIVKDQVKSPCFRRLVVRLRFQQGAVAVSEDNLA